MEIGQTTKMLNNNSLSCFVAPGMHSTVQSLKMANKSSFVSSHQQSLTVNRVPSTVNHGHSTVSMNTNGRGVHGGSDKFGIHDPTSTVLYDFLTRRSVNTLIYYFDEFHDGPSKNWLEKFENFKEREIGFTQSDEFLLKMMSSRPEKGVMTVSHPKGYFKRQFPFTIEPRRIAERILAIREQLSVEWKKDLRLISSENNELQRLHLELALQPNISLDSIRKKILDSDPFANDTSALRSSNYRKLKVLLTHHASYAVLQDLHKSDNHSYMWLESFLKTHSVENDEDFVFTLMRTPNVTRVNPDSQVSPLHIAGDILQKRLEIARDWRFLLTSTAEANRKLTLTTLLQSTNLEEVFDPAKVRVDPKSQGFDTSSDDFNQAQP